MDRKEFEELTGRPPENDDLDRVNCDKAGQFRHEMCGICCHCGQPRFVCGGLLAHAMPEPMPVDPLDIPKDPNSLDLGGYARSVLKDRGINPDHNLNVEAMTILEQELTKLAQYYIGEVNTREVRYSIKRGVDGIIENLNNQGVFWRW